MIVIFQIIDGNLIFFSEILIFNLLLYYELNVVIPLVQSKQRGLNSISSVY